MGAMFCPRCRLQQPMTHAFCVRCGSDLPAHLLDDDPAPKRVRFFAGVRVADSDPEGAFLRVSCYLKEQLFETPDGSVRIPGHHVRFSVWIGHEARSVISLPETEALELARFIVDEMRHLNDSTGPMPVANGD